MKYEIIEKIGEGLVGLVYKVKYNGGLYCLKRQRILEKDVNNLNQSWLGREIEFAKKMEKYPCCFIKLHEYQIIKNCESLISPSDTTTKERIKILNKSPYCVELIYDLLDGSLLTILPTLDLKQRYSMIIQVMYGVYLFRGLDYCHNDLTTRNIGYVKTSDEYININNMKVPTYGYIYKIIDYGQVKAKNMVLYKFIDNIDLIRFCKSFNRCTNRSFKRQKIDNIEKLIMKTPQYKEIKKYVVSSDGYVIKRLIELYYKLLYTREYLIMVKIDESEIDKYTEHMIPVADQLFILEHRKIPLKIILYLCDKLEKIN